MWGVGLQRLDEREGEQIASWRRVDGEVLGVNDWGQTFKIESRSSHHEIVSPQQFR